MKDYIQININKNSLEIFAVIIIIIVLGICSILGFHWTMMNTYYESGQANGAQQIENKILSGDDSLPYRFVNSTGSEKILYAEQCPDWCDYKPNPNLVFSSPTAGKFYMGATNYTSEMWME